jgi:hypothetical protein
MTERDPNQQLRDDVTARPTLPPESTDQPATTQTMAVQTPAAESPNQPAPTQTTAVQTPAAESPNQPAPTQTTAVQTPAAESPNQPAPTQTTAVQTPRSSGNGLRWAVALVVTVLVVGIAAAAFVLLAGQTSPSKLIGYAPNDAVVYGELRLDLPGDQREKLGDFLSKFPGFADQSTLDAKLDDALDRIVRAATNGKQDYTTKIKPWFGGQMAITVGKLPSPNAASDARGLVILSVTDAAKARAWFDALTSDLPKTTESYNGVDLVLTGEGTKKAIFGVSGDVMLAGDEASVKAAIDSKGGGGFGANERFRNSLSSVRGDSLGYFFVDGQAYGDWFGELSKTAASPVPGLDSLMRRFLPSWMLFRIQAHGDAVAVEGVFPSLATEVKRENRVGAIAPHVPASTIAFVDGHDYGAGLLELIDVYRNNPSTQEAFKQIDQAVAIVGGFDTLLGWMRDASIVVTRDGATVHGGLVFTATERAAADRFLATVRSFAVLGGGQAGITVRDESYNGATITTIDLGDLRDLAGMAGMRGSMPIEGHLEIAYASTADVVVIGVGDAFVKSVLDAGSGSSLADVDRYKALLARVGDRNLGAGFVDITAVRELLETHAATQPRFGEYLRDYKPYLVPFDAYVQANVIDGDLDRSTGVVVVK